MTPGSHLVASVDQLLGSPEPFRPGMTWASAIQQVGFLGTLIVTHLNSAMFISSLQFRPQSRKQAVEAEFCT